MMDSSSGRPRDEDDHDSSSGPHQDDTPNKKPRIFVARQACERCRLKKTRCDEDFPCSLCRVLGVECKYGDRKTTRNEASFSTVMSLLHRIENKIENISSKPPATATGGPSFTAPTEPVPVPVPVPTTVSAAATTASLGYHGGPSTPRGVVTVLEAGTNQHHHNHHHHQHRHSLPGHYPPAPSPASLGGGGGITSPAETTTTTNDAPSSHHHPPHSTPISFSAHKVLQWPAVAARLPPEVATICLEHGTNYVASLEARRANIPLPASLDRNMPGGGGNYYTPFLAITQRGNHNNNNSSNNNNRDTEDENKDPSLARLSVSVITTLCDAYFATFHLAHPILDRRVFSHHTLSVAIQRGFDYDIESCVVLTVMALGCWGIRALREAGFAPSPCPDAAAGGTTTTTTSSDRIRLLDDGLGIEQYLGRQGSDCRRWRDGVPGLMFFNEARKRVGFLRNDSGMQTCQFHLLDGLFYAQMVRPLDWYTCIGRAASCCLMFWECSSSDCDEWVLDMQSRLFWITVMAESVLADELSLPISRLAQIQERVPLPRFVKLERNPFLSLVDNYYHDHYGASSSRAYDGSTNSATARHNSQQGGNTGNGTGGSDGGGGGGDDIDDDLFYNYHFLSQIAHRILLTRMKDSLYYSSSTRNYPPATLEDELNHQHQQWRSQLPPALYFREDQVIPASATPWDILVVAWLRSRFVVAKIHLARPFLHKVLSRPDLRSPAVISKCREIFADFLQWGSVLNVLLMMKNCLPLRFNLAAQLFGQYLILYAFKNNEDTSLAGALPHGYQAWCTFVLNLLEETAPLSPSMARDAQIAAVLYPKLVGGDAGG